MLNQDLTITRGAGALDEVYDFDGVLDITVNDKIEFRMEDKVDPLIQKRNDNAGGSDSEVELDADLNTVTVHFSELEKNGTPDSGWILKLFINGVQQAYGVVTASGSEPAGTPPPPSLQYNNGRMNSRIIIDDYLLSIDDDIIYADPPDGTNKALTYNGADEIKDKEYHIFNIATGSGQVHIDITGGTITLDAGEQCWIRAKAIIDSNDFLIIYNTGSFA